MAKREKEPEAQTAAAKHSQGTPETLATFKNLLTHKSPTNRHDRCVPNTFCCQDQNRKSLMSPVSQAINNLRPLKPIQERAFDIIRQRSYRMNVLRESEAVKKKQQEDLSMKKLRRTQKTPSKHLKTENTVNYNNPTTLEELKQEVSQDKTKAQQLLRNAVLRKQDRTPTTLVQRLRQLSPYAPYERRQHDIIYDDIALGTTARHYMHQLTPRQHLILRERRSITPNYNRLDMEQQTTVPKTKHIRANKKPNVDIRRILEQNKEQIMAYIGQVLQKQLA